MKLRTLHHRLTTVLSLTAVIAFVSGAGLDAPSVLPATALLLIGLIWDPSERLRARLELMWRVLAMLLALRAAYHTITSPEDVVLPMVDLLLLLVLAETFRAQDATGEARLYALSFALLIASAAYRPGALFGLAFVIYLAVLTATLIVGHLARQTRERNLREPRLPRGFVLQSAGISGIALLVSLMVFMAFPRVSRGWATRGAPVLRNVIGFSDRVSLLDHGGQLYSNPEVVLRVEFPGQQPPPAERLYWRGRSYDRFDGASWSRSPFLATNTINPERWPDGRIEQVVYQTAIMDVNVLFGLSPVLRVSARSRIAPFRENNGDFLYGGGAQPVYTAMSAAELPHPDSLRNAVGTVPRVIGAYLRLPPLSDRTYALADSLTRGRTTHYDKAVAVRDWLRSEFQYTIQLPANAREATLEWFLFNRRAGHCEYFSTAMAVLLRAAGVPTRNVNGFAGGEWNDFGDFLTVTQNQAHSWVEVWFPGYGWVQFDPTPAGAAGITADADSWWSPLRYLFSGVEHRWGKWILDYDLEKQADMLRRATDAFTEPVPTGGNSPGSIPWRNVLVVLGVAVMLGALARTRWPGRGARAPASAATRAYLKLRKAYTRAGLADASTPPLILLQRVRAASAAGADHAAVAVDLYTRARFGGETIDQHTLAEAVRAARSELRREGRGRTGTRPSTP